jgi:hypothetical protein
MYCVSLCCSLFCSVYGAMCISWIVSWLGAHTQTHTGHQSTCNQVTIHEIHHIYLMMALCYRKVNLLESMD